MGTLYEHAGGKDAMLRLTEAMHARCLADPELNHPFTHSGLNPDHTPRLAAYWAEVLGGPGTFTARYGGESTVMRMHSGNGDMDDLGDRFETCFAQAIDDAGLPDEPAFRAALRAYMHWAVLQMVAHPNAEDVIPDGIAVPRWTWDGLASS